MKQIDVRTIYDPKDLADDWFCISDYQPMIAAFGKIAVQVDGHNYQGETRVLYDNDGKIGHLIFGWGSCTGCDALQACRTVEDVQKLCDELQDDIKWFDTATEALEWFSTHDWEGDYISRSIEYLRNKIEAESPVEQPAVCFDRIADFKLSESFLLDLIKNGMKNKDHSIHIRFDEDGVSVTIHPWSDENGEN